MQVYYAILHLTKQFPAPQKSGITSANKVIHLTFDDGPYEYTEQLLEVLNRFNVTATFFVTNRVKYIDILSKISSAGHAIGNHTANHNYDELYASETSFLNALNQMEGIIQEKTGIRPTLFRFPGGSCSINLHSPHNGMAHRLTALVQEHGYQYFDWHVDSRDTAEAHTPGAVYWNVIFGVRNKKENVVLLHDIKKYSVSAVEAILVWGLKNGYTFLPLRSDSLVVHHKINS